MTADRTYQITVDCADPDTLARFWAPMLGYELEGPPEPHTSWKAYWISVGVPADEVADGYDSIVDPSGARPRVWFQQVPEPKQVKNRLHFDVLVGGGRSVPLDERKRRVRTEADRASALGATKRRVIDNSAYDHFAIAMADPEGNEFDIV
jgi:hypothetical protein